jgi:hypothetical protein
VKFAKIFALVVLLGCSAAVAHADAGNDPTVHVNKFPDPACPPTDSTYVCFNTNNQGDPLFIPVTSGDVNPPDTYIWDGQGALTELFVEFTYTPGLLYTCQSDVFALCGTVAPSVNPATDLEFEFEDGSIAPCTPSGDCTGVQAYVPEPNSILLLFAGLLGLLAFAKRRSAKSVDVRTVASA